MRRLAVERIPRALAGSLLLPALLLARPPHARAQPADDLAATTIIYARGTALYKSDGKGKNEAQLVAIPPNTVVRALRTDAAATVLLADLGGKWSWMPLDGAAKTLAELPCADGPA
jgi:hypothetical protein